MTKDCHWSVPAARVARGVALVGAVASGVLAYAAQNQSADTIEGRSLTATVAIEDLPKALEEFSSEDRSGFSFLPAAFAD